MTDNIIAAYECLHSMKQKRASDQRCCALKLDMKKAYDRVEWAYLRAIMTQLGFHRLWVDMVMRLISTVSFSVLFRRSYFSVFVPFGSRGPLVPLKVKNSIIDSQRYKGSSISSGGKPSSLCG